MANQACTIILSYNEPACTIACVESLLQGFTPARDIVVVDNGSADGTAAAIRASFPDVHLIALDQNLGWAGGNNVGIRYALSEGYEYLCLLNNDTLLPPNAIAMLVRSAERSGSCLMHPVIKYAQAEEGYQLDPRQDLNGTGGLPPGLPRSEDPEVFELSYAYGACLVIPAALFRMIGLLDERFFLQLEETDFWIRARRIGVVSLCDTRVQITHIESKSFGGRMTPAKVYYICRNTLLLTEKSRCSLSGYHAALKSIIWVLAKQVPRTRTIAVVLGLLNVRSPERYARAVRAGLRDYVLRRFGAISNATLSAVSASPEPVNPR